MSSGEEESSWGLKKGVVMVGEGNVGVAASGEAEKDGIFFKFCLSSCIEK